MTLTVELSPQRMARVAAEWGEIAGESVAIENVKGFVYAYGTELGMRRLAHKFRSFNVGYSKNLSTWYFCNERREGEER